MKSVDNVHGVYREQELYSMFADVSKYVPALPLMYACVLMKPFAAMSTSTQTSPATGTCGSADAKSPID